MSNQKFIDLRSDTVTRPSAGMRRAMVNAEVGDDVFGEDPTVNTLQETVAALLGKEAALFVPSGVMANQLAIKVHTQPGDEILAESGSHIFNYETAGPSVISHVQVATIHGRRGILCVDDLLPAIRSSAYYMPRTSLICLENTHNRAGGTIYPLDEIRNIYRFAKERGIALHLDGARIWNASAATGISPNEYASYADTISVCFSKGLGAPVGSALLGSSQMIEKARKYRKMLGGGMRQAGILAAGALYALEHHRERLREDHEKAQFFAKEVASVPGFEVDLEAVQTNIVMMDIAKTRKSTAELLHRLRNRGVLLTEMSYSALRAVMHRDVTMHEVQEATSIIKSTFS